jgi:nitrite reductase/ring-hydroxylating ferredoxin subunit
VGALASAVTGLTDWHVLQKGSKSRKVGVVHALLNISATLLYGGSLLLRKSNRRGLAKLFSGAGYGLVGISSYLGGILVYEQKIGVDHAPREGFPAEWTAVMPEEELAEEKPTLAKAGEIDIVLYRGTGTIRALANTCSHLGGPLCEGEVKDGGIVCPWHQSRFDLTNGEVLDGPATFRQPAFVVRVMNGQIEVKPSNQQPAAATSID